MTNILVIEDDDAIREDISTILEFEGFSVLGAANGEAGIENAFTHIPDLILCDISMPIMDGYEVLKALRSDPATQSVCFIFMSAKNTTNDLQLGLSLGADGYLPKPFSRDQLLDSVRGCLDEG